MSQKDAPNSKLKKKFRPLSKDWEGKTIEISNLNILAIGCLLWETLYVKINLHRLFLQYIIQSTIVATLC